MDGKILCALCFALALSACSTTSPKYQYETVKNTATEPKPEVYYENTRPEPEVYYENTRPEPLGFSKQESGSSALKVAINKTKSQKPYQINALNETAEFVDNKVELARYTFGIDNSIYIANFKNSLMFDHDKSSVREDDKQLVNNFAKLYRDGTFGKYLYIIGHTDADGSASYNYALSASRAIAVASILLLNGFPESEINIVPAGEYLPKASNKTRSGKQLNRRVEVLSANSRALIQAYLRQLQCPVDETCSRKLLNVFDVRKNGQTAEMSLANTQVFATFSPELNNLAKLDNALRTGSISAENLLLESDDKRALIQMGETRRAFTIPVDIRPVFRIKKEIRHLRIPKEYIIQ